MTPDDLNRYRALRDRRFNRAWWAFFLLGCLGVFASALTPNGAHESAWLILCGLCCMIVGRQQYGRRLAQVDAYADLLAARDAHAAKTRAAKEATLTAETAQALAESLQRLDEATKSLAKSLGKLKADAEQRTGDGRDDEQSPPRP